MGEPFWLMHVLQPHPYHTPANIWMNQQVPNPDPRPTAKNAYPLYLYER